MTHTVSDITLSFNTSHKELQKYDGCRVGSQNTASPGYTNEPVTASGFSIDIVLLIS